MLYRDLWLGRIRVGMVEKRDQTEGDDDGIDAGALRKSVFSRTAWAPGSGKIV